MRFRSCIRSRAQLLWGIFQSFSSRKQLPRLLCVHGKKYFMRPWLNFHKNHECLVLLCFTYNYTFSWAVASTSVVTQATSSTRTECNAVMAMLIRAYSAAPKFLQTLAKMISWAVTHTRTKHNACISSSACELMLFQCGCKFIFKLKLQEFQYDPFPLWSWNDLLTRNWALRVWILVIFTFFNLITI